MLFLVEASFAKGAVPKSQTSTISCIVGADKGIAERSLHNEVGIRSNDSIGYARI